jgi:hypothetical protein
MWRWIRLTQKAKQSPSFKDRKAQKRRKQMRALGRDLCPVCFKRGRRAKLIALPEGINVPISVGSGDKSRTGWIGSRDLPSELSIRCCTECRWHTGAPADFAEWSREVQKRELPYGKAVMGLKRWVWEMTGSPYFQHLTPSFWTGPEYVASQRRRIKSVRDDIMLSAASRLAKADLDRVILTAMHPVVQPSAPRDVKRKLRALMSVARHVDPEKVYRVNEDLPAEHAEWKESHWRHIRALDDATWAKWEAICLQDGFIDSDAVYNMLRRIRKQWSLTDPKDLAISKDNMMLDLLLFMSKVFSADEYKSVSIDMLKQHHHSQVWRAYREGALELFDIADIKAIKAAMTSARRGNKNKIQAVEPLIPPVVMLEWEAAAQSKLDKVAIWDAEMDKLMRRFRDGKKFVMNSMPVAVLEYLSMLDDPISGIARTFLHAENFQQFRTHDPEWIGGPIMALLSDWEAIREALLWQRHKSGQMTGLEAEIHDCLGYYARLAARAA